jgi:hypothetical protein
MTETEYLRKCDGIDRLRNDQTVSMILPGSGPCWLTSSSTLAHWPTASAEQMARYCRLKARGSPTLVAPHEVEQSVNRAHIGRLRRAAQPRAANSPRPSNSLAKCAPIAQTKCISSASIRTSITQHLSRSFFDPCTNPFAAGRPLGRLSQSGPRLLPSHIGMDRHANGLVCTFGGVSRRREWDP